MNRPEGALTADELEELLMNTGRFRVYLPKGWYKWKYFIRLPQRHLHPEYRVEHEDGRVEPLDMNGVAYAMRKERFWVFVNYWHYYAYCLKEGVHEQFLP